MYRSALTSANRQVHKRTPFHMLNEVNTSHAQSQSETVWARAERCKAATPWTAGNKLPISTIWCGHLSSIFISVIVFSLIFSFICSMCTCKIWTKPMQAAPIQHHGEHPANALLSFVSVPVLKTTAAQATQEHLTNELGLTGSDF